MVVKLGSSQIVDGRLRPKIKKLGLLAKQVAKLHKKHIEVILVSSGAIALGMGELKERERPTELAALQARAAIGQAVLMRLYCELFGKEHLKCGQVLLTWDDFEKRHFLNARNALEAILKQGVVPIINENDTTSTEEIKFGDNDKLSALVARSLHADLLVILSDVPGFYNQDKQVIEKIEQITPEIYTMSSGTLNIRIARGGMRTKIHAIDVATQAGIPCIITDGSEDDVLWRLVNKRESLGTHFIEIKG
ncbi:MAG TPA: glutamate 5-kinase [Candidatus Omnitrophota bacterium]|nr:glutamate 5-kinase [Candidatus Omnitrophota bacterium]